MSSSAVSLKILFDRSIFYHCSRLIFLHLKNQLIFLCPFFPDFWRGRLICEHFLSHKLISLWCGVFALGVLKIIFAVVYGGCIWSLGQKGVERQRSVHMSLSAAVVGR